MDPYFLRPDLESMRISRQVREALEGASWRAQAEALQVDHMIGEVFAIDSPAQKLMREQQQMLNSMHEQAALLAKSLAIQAVDPLSLAIDSLNAQQRAHIATIQKSVGSLSAAAIGLDNLVTPALRPRRSNFVTSLPALSDVNNALEGLVAEEKGELPEAEAALLVSDRVQQYLEGFGLIIGDTPAEIVATREQIDHSHTLEFRNHLADELRQSDTLRRRWDIVDRALEIHCNSDYAIAIPALLAQVEGVFRDSLVLRDVVFFENDKLYRYDDKGGKFEINGLYNLLKDSPYKGSNPNHLLNAIAAQFTTHKLSKRRNGILHGSDLDYGEPELSAKLLLFLIAVAPDIADFEAGRAGNNTHADET